MSKRVVFVGMMGAPGSYDQAVYAHLPDKDNEGAWIQERFGHVDGIIIDTCNACLGEPLPHPDDVDGLLLGGSYNSVHDNTAWQQAVRTWLPKVRRSKIPTLGVCGAHQLVSQLLGSAVETVNDGPFAGTFPVHLTEHGRVSPLFEGIEDSAEFQYTNAEHVVGVPKGSMLLAASEKVPVAALDFGDHFYSTQFHPEGTLETMSTVWRFDAPERMENYVREENGRRLVENFLGIVANR